MKTILFLTLLFSLTLFGQDVSTTLSYQEFYVDTMTATIDTIDITISAYNQERFNEWTVAVYSLNDVDTIIVCTRSKDNTFWIQQSLTDLSSGSAVTQIITSTTPKEFLISDPQPKKIRLIIPDVTATGDYIVVSGKKSD
jgi:hypothetical protein